MRHIAQAQDRDFSARMANGLSEGSARCYLIAVKTGELLCETLPKVVHVAIIPYGVRVLSGTGIKNHIVREPPPTRFAAALYSKCLGRRHVMLEGTQTSPTGAT